MSLHDFAPDELDFSSLKQIPESSSVGGILKIRQEPILDENQQTIIKRAGVFYEVLKPDRYEDSWFEDSDKLDCYFLLYRDERVHFSSPSSREWDCKSLNGETPILYKYASECKICPMNSYYNPNTKNPCRFYISLLVLVPKPGEKDMKKALVPYTVQIGRSGYKNVVAFINGTVKKFLMEENKVSPYAVPTRISVQNDGRYYVPVFPPHEFYAAQIEKLKKGDRGSMPKPMFEFIKEKREELYSRFIVKPELPTKTLELGLEDSTHYLPEEVSSNPASPNFLSDDAVDFEFGGSDGEDTKSSNVSDWLKL